MAQNFLKNFGPMGEKISSGISFLDSGLTLSAIMGFAISNWEKAVNYLYQPNVLVGWMVFFAAYWTYIGWIYISDRKRTKTVKLFADYAYGLAYQGTQLRWSTSSEVGGLQAVLQFKNCAIEPIKYTITDYDFRVGSRTIRKHDKGIFASFVPKGAMKLAKSNLITVDEVREYFDKKIDGCVEFSVRYGAVDGEPVRSLKMIVKLEIILHADGKFGFSEVIAEEEDTALT